MRALLAHGKRQSLSGLSEVGYHSSFTDLKTEAQVTAAKEFSEH